MRQRKDPDDPALKPSPPRSSAKFVPDGVLTAHEIDAAI